MLNKNAMPLKLRSIIAWVMILMLVISAAACTNVGEVTGGTEEGGTESTENTDGAETVSVNRITFSEPSGFYDEAFELTITAEQGDTIYYTLDGSMPTTESAVYSGPITIDDASKNENVYCMRDDTSVYFMLGTYHLPDVTIDKCNVIRAAVFDEAGNLLQEKYASYFVGFQDKEGYQNMSFVSLITDPDNMFDNETGIYVLGKTYDDAVEAGVDMGENERYWPANYREKGREWEREAYMTVFSPEKELLCDQKIGVRIKGHGTRVCLPKSFNLYARKEYGNNHFEADLPQVGYESKKLALYGAGNDRAKIKNVLAAELTADLNVANLSYEPCVVFLDGEYWGVYWITDKFDNLYFKNHYGMDKDNLVYIKGGELEIGEEGDFQIYEDFVDFCESNDMSDPANYEAFKSMVDMESFLDYYATEVYLANHDWPSTNFGLWRSRVAGDGEYADTKWRWTLFDTDEDCMDQWYADYDSIEHAKERDVIFNSLCDNAEFRQVFSERLILFSKTVYAPETVQPVLDKYVNLMFYPIELETERYNFGEEEVVWQRGEYMRGFFEKRPESIKGIIESNFPDVTVE